MTGDKIIICDKCGNNIIWCKCVPLMDKQTLRLISDIEEVLAETPDVD